MVLLMIMKSIGSRVMINVNDEIDLKVNELVHEKVRDQLTEFVQQLIEAYWSGFDLLDAESDFMDLFPDFDFSHDERDRLQNKMHYGFI